MSDARSGKGLVVGFPEAYDVAFYVAEPSEGAGGDGNGGDYGFAAGGFDLLERGLDVVGLDVEVGELVGLVGEGGDVGGDPLRGAGIDKAHGTGVDGPAEDVLVEGAGCFFIFAADFEVNDGV